MKSNVPWSVKGIDPQARVVAKEAARKAGMTLGEWMTSMINEVGTENDRPDETAANQAQPVATGVSPDQLRAVVDSLNRLNERLKSTEENLKRTEEKSREAMGGLNQGLETVFERVKRMETARNDVQAAVADAAPANTPESRERLESLKALEKALTGMLEQFETTRSDTLVRVAENEKAISSLGDRVDVLDQRINAGFQEVHDALDAVGDQLDQTERTAKAVMLEAKEASNSTDAEFVERTGKKLQLLGNEIKRSGDQISAVESMVSSLSEKIEAAERRSAHGIDEVHNELIELRTDVMTAERAHNERDPELKAAAAAAEETVASLQKSYDEMIARMEGRLSAVEDATSSSSPAQAMPLAATGASTSQDIPDPDIAKSPSVSPQDAMKIAMTTLQPSGDPNGGGDVPNLAAGPSASEPDAAADSDAEFDAVFGDGEPSTASADTPDADEDKPPMTAREKIIAAAKARKERVERERAAEEAAAAESDPSMATPDPNIVAEQDEAYAAAGYRDQNRDKKLGLPLLGMIGLCAVGLIGAVVFFFGGRSERAPEPAEVQEVAPTPVAENTVTPEPVTSTPEPAPIDTTPDAAALYAEGKTFLGSNDGRAFTLMREAALYGNVPAQYRLGEMYYTGAGTQQDLREAKRWFESAALSGNALAMHRLGSLAIEAPNGQPQYEQALDWFARAANYGVVDSQYNLGLLYDPASDYLPASMRSADQSYRYYMLAAGQGDAQAEADAALVAESMDPARVEAIDAEVAASTPLPIDPRVNDGLSVTY